MESKDSKVISMEDYKTKNMKTGDDFLSVATGNDEIGDIEELNTIMSYINNYYDLELKNKTIRELKNEALTIINNTPKEYLEAFDRTLISSLYESLSADSYDRLTIQDFLLLGENSDFTNNNYEYNRVMLFINHYYHFSLSTTKIEKLKQKDLTIIPISLSEALKNSKYDNCSIMNYILLYKLAKLSISEKEIEPESYIKSSSFLKGVLSFKIISEELIDKSLLEGDLSRIKLQISGIEDIERKLRRALNIKIGSRFFNLRELYNYSLIASDNKEQKPTF